MKVAGILFDKDGTLVDFDRTWGAAAHAVLGTMSRGDPATYARLAEAMHYVAEERRFRPTSPMIAGSTADYVHLWGEILDRAGDPDLGAEIDEHFGRETLAALAPVECPAEILAVLHARGFRLGIATNDAETSARAQAERLGLLPWLDFVVGYDSGHGGKPEPGMVTAFARHIGVSPDRVALVGDSVHDLQAARAAGAVAIAVLSGPAQRAVLEPLADCVVTTIAELPALLQVAEAP
jgi:phosphoglycolate phosphatase